MCFSATYCALLLKNVQLYCCVVHGEWVGVRVDPFVGGLSMGLCGGVDLFFPRYTGPALAEFDVPLVSAYCQ